LRTPDTEEGEPLEYVDADDDSDDNDEEEEEEDEEKDGDEAEEWNSDNNGEDVRGINGRNRRFPPLSPREKKELRAYAHSLGKKIVSQQVQYIENTLLFALLLVIGMSLFLLFSSFKVCSSFSRLCFLFFPICLLVITGSKCIAWIVEGLISCLEM
jgi:hypothetical protein